MTSELKKKLLELDYNIDNEIYDFIYKFNLLMIFSGNDNIFINFNKKYLEKKINYIIAGSSILSYIYNKNEMAEIDEIIRYNIDKKVKINYENIQTNIQDYIKNSIWSSLKGISFEQLIDSRDFDVHIMVEDDKDEFNFDDDADKAKIKLILEKISTNIIKTLNTNMSNISDNLNVFINKNTIRIFFIVMIKNMKKITKNMMLNH